MLGNLLREIPLLDDSLKDVDERIALHSAELQAKK
jgi:hypothetical protein